VKTQSLKALVEVAKYGNISRAAISLQVSQPRLSQTISEIETAYGEVLFQRTGRGILPTAAGERAVEIARDILSDLAMVKAEMIANAQNNTELIVIGVTPSVGPILVPPMIMALKQAMPGLTLRIVEGYSGVIQRSLTDGELDIALLYSIQSYSGAPADRVLVERMLLVGAPNDPVLDHPEIPLWDVAKLPLIMPSRTHGLRKLIDREARRAGIELNVVFEMDSLTPTLDLCASGNAYSILPSCAVARDTALGLVKARPIVDPDIKRTLNLLTTTAHPLTSATRTAARLCVETAQRLVRDGKWLADIC
jgi:LysR family transcriptional regulator, nitrogen assimilation regulatory protein